MERSAFPQSPTPVNELQISEQVRKGEAFRALHERGEAFILPNPWDVGTVRLLAHLGFEALATTSAGYAFSRGKCDGGVSREEMMVHIAEVAAASPLPVNADLLNGFGDALAVAAETISLAAAAGAAGGSIEDATGRLDSPVYELEHAADRIRAAAEAARALPFRFTLTARAENHIVGRPDLKDTIRRLQAYQDAGADVLYAPGLSTRDEIRAVVSSVDRPVNVLMGMAGVRLTRADLSALGVRRISVGSALARAALGAFLRGAKEMGDRGTFTFADEAASFRELNEIFKS